MEIPTEATLSNIESTTTTLTTTSVDIMETEPTNGAGGKKKVKTAGATKEEMATKSNSTIDTSSQNIQNSKPSTAEATTLVSGESNQIEVDKRNDQSIKSMGTRQQQKNANEMSALAKTSTSTTTTATQIQQAQNQPNAQTSPEGSAGAVIPENILSPPKSDTQTEETNTATSSSPASNSQLSPIAATSTATTEDITCPSTVGNRVVQPINVVANGTIPNAGKPLLSALNKKLKPERQQRQRERKQKVKVAMYESEISDNKTGIKLCIKKSDTSGNNAFSATTPAKSTGAATTKTPSTTASTEKQTNRKRSRKGKQRARVDSDDSEYETKKKKERASNNNSGEKQKKSSVSSGGTTPSEDIRQQPLEQSDWATRIPKEILFQIFQNVVDTEGCLPTLTRLGRVCSLWRQVSLNPHLWKVMDLSTWIKEKYRTEPKLKWFVDNRGSFCTELNASNWKISDINCVLSKLEKGCPNLTGITLSGWNSLTSDHLSFLVERMKKLERIDLSSINVELTANKSAVGLQSLCNALQTMNGRLTHLYLAHNRLAGIPQIVTTLATYCPNLMLLDLSNVTTQATSHGVLHIEKLQHGCGKLRVLRVTNSHVTLSSASMQEMMDSPGFPELEELSVAALNDESRIISDEHLQRILKTSSKLKLLDVRNCARLTHESLIRLPAWDIKHLFLSGCSVVRDMGSGLELIASKWAHSLIELDLAWANVQQPLDNALRAIAEKGIESPLAHLNLCGSSVSEDAVKDILANCAYMSSINLSSCRGLPRGVKRLMQGPQELQELREVLKVQMKVKLPSQLKKEQEEAAVAAAIADAGDATKTVKSENEIAADGNCGVNSLQGY